MVEVSLAGSRCSKGVNSKSYNHSSDSSVDSLPEAIRQACNFLGRRPPRF
jgi:hypothetical protein